MKNKVTFIATYIFLTAVCLYLFACNPEEKSIPGTASMAVFIFPITMFVSKKKNMLAVWLNVIATALFVLTYLLLFKPLPSNLL